MELHAALAQKTTDRCWLAISPPRLDVVVSADRERQTNVVDHLRNSLDTVAGRMDRLPRCCVVHPSAAGGCTGNSVDPPDHGQKGRLTHDGSIGGRLAHSATRA